MSYRADFLPARWLGHLLMFLFDPVEDWVQSRRASRMTSLLEEYSPASTARRTTAAISVGNAMLSFWTVGMEGTSVV